MITVKDAEKMFKIEWATIDHSSPEYGVLNIKIDAGKFNFIDRETRTTQQSDFDTFMYAFRKELGEVYFSLE